MQEGVGTSARLNWMYFVTSVGSRGCAVHVEARARQTPDTLQESPGHGPDLPQDRGGDCIGNGCYRSRMYKPERFCLWTQ